MQLQDILNSQGFGTRRVCAGLIQQGLVQAVAFWPSSAKLLIFTTPSGKRATTSN
jgi:16S rRNA pseudouridine516 synthase